jgi:hypothetical protein
MFKACKYAINDTKINVGMKEMNVAKVQNGLQKKTITWTKKSRKGRAKKRNWCGRKLARDLENSRH